MKTKTKKPAPKKACDDCLYHKAWYPDVTLEAFMATCPVCGKPEDKIPTVKPFYGDEALRLDRKKKDAEGVWHLLSNEARAALASEGLAPEGVLLSPKKAAVPSEAASKPAKAASESKKGQSAIPKRPGVITRIVEVLRQASKANPVTKEAILALLVKSFPEREEKAMRNTVSSQVPSALKAEKGLVVQTDGAGGYWLPKE